MDDLLSEKEQIEQIRSWWSEYGGYVIGGLGIGIAILVGWNYFQSSRLNAQLEASSMYETLATHVVEGRLEAAEGVANDIGTTFGSTPYAAQAKLALARLYMDKNRDQDAADVLNDLLTGEAADELKHVARARLARILLYQGKPEAVVELLEGIDVPSFAPTYNELLGDAYQALGRIEDAQAAYQLVLMDPLSRATVDQQLVQWKVLDLPEVAAGAPEASAEPEKTDATDDTTAPEAEERE